MKKALISPLEPVYDLDANKIGVRVAEIAEEEFDVAEPLYWIACEDTLVADNYCFDESSSQFISIPKPIVELTLQDLLELNEALQNMNQT